MSFAAVVALLRLPARVAAAGGPARLGNGLAVFSRSVVLDEPTEEVARSVVEGVLGVP